MNFSFGVSDALLLQKALFIQNIRKYTADCLEQDERLASSNEPLASGA
jgi:hypothetical protein